jgi:hypothetical protein
MEIRIDTWFNTGKSLCKELPIIINSQNLFSPIENDDEDDDTFQGDKFEKITETLEAYYAIRVGSYLCGFEDLKTLIEEGHKAVYVYVKDDDWPHGGNDQAFVWVGNSLNEIKEKVSSLAKPLYDKIIEHARETEECLEDFTDQYNSTE